MVENSSASPERFVGRTQSAGVQIGVSRTLPHRVEVVWDLMVGPVGLALWLGPGARLSATKADPYVAADGTRGELRSRREHDRVRATWQPAGWSHDTIVQFTVQDAGAGRTVLRFHQEWLADAQERDRQREHWTRVMDQVAEALDTQAS